MEHGYIYRCEINDYRWLLPVRACEQEAEWRNALRSVSTSAHTCTSVVAFCEKEPDFQSVPWSLLLSWCQVQSLSVISGNSPAPPARFTVGHNSVGEIRSQRRLQHLNLSGNSSGNGLQLGWGGWSKGRDLSLPLKALLLEQLEDATYGGHGDIFVCSFLQTLLSGVSGKGIYGFPNDLTLHLPNTWYSKQYPALFSESHLNELLIYLNFKKETQCVPVHHYFDYLEALITYFAVATSDGMCLKGEQHERLKQHTQDNGEDLYMLQEWLRPHWTTLDYFIFAQQKLKTFWD